MATAFAAGPAAARPVYFDHFRSLYGITDGDNLNACGVCHINWAGTGARNPYGQTVEQQIYIGKTIVQSLIAVEGLDPDMDGYTSGDEILNWMTLPGYNCDNYVLAAGAPIGYDTYITPMVATCLEPLDIRVDPPSVASFITVGSLGVMNVRIINNGSSDPIEIDSYGLLAGAPPSLSVHGPAAPLSIPVGSSIDVEVHFAPLSEGFALGTLRIESNDPDESIIDVPVFTIGLADPTAPGPQRAVCLETMSKAVSRYSKAHLKEWARCYQDEAAGRACDTGSRDYRIGRAADKLASVLGGPKDKSCAATGLSAPSLGFPTTCTAGCEHITLTSMKSVADCQVCAQERVMEGFLRDGLGTAPPDLPPNVVTGAGALKCQAQILKAMQKTLLRMYRDLSSCELAAVAAEEDGGACRAQLASQLEVLRQKLDDVVGKCSDTADLLGCRFEGMSPDPQCLGLAAEDLASFLTDGTFALY